MTRNHYSATYTAIIDMLFRLGKQAKLSPIYSNSLTNGVFDRSNSGATSHKLPQPIVISDADLWSKCTTAEWHLIGRISHELKEYNALWASDSDSKKNNSSVRNAIKGLIEKNILVKTETTDIYLVNPVHIRRGDTFAVLTTTASLLMDEHHVAKEHIVDKKPVKQFNINGNSNNIQEIGWGYVDPNTN